MKSAVLLFLVSFFASVIEFLALLILPAHGQETILWIVMIIIMIAWIALHFDLDFDGENITWRRW